MSVAAVLDGATQELHGCADKVRAGEPLPPEVAASVDELGQAYFRLRAALLRCSVETTPKARHDGGLPA